MTDLRQRHSETPSGSPGSDQPGAPENPTPPQVHQQTQQFLAAGHQLIQAALSGNSQAFLAASRQQGGQ